MLAVLVFYYFYGMNVKFEYAVSKPFEEDLVDVLTEVESPYNLIVWNDEVNTFEWVIETLIEVCGHSQEQAEQCAYIIHFQGKYAVKKGDFDTLKPMKEAITERGIGATIESTVSI
ncbi:ATP-dependent Clp protease adaptor ClpS [Danxiaibacter flavus]|uniref:ATP-dependent Clp protease adaptor ClpS n=1 Tax=Danxiaibacter flavus TaxID=3049108 RepID=A0ABV3ZC02_9BACT|nr:ATP-dependent Clp protease adaptor ClpS [Chitinophagaceae bacterium DXS]